MKKLERKLAKLSTSAGKVTRSFAKKEHLGHLLGDILRAGTGAAMQNQGIPMNQYSQYPQQQAPRRGGVARGRGAYGRGAYTTGAGVNVNSLFRENKARRHRTNEIGDETGRVRVSRREYVMRVVAPSTAVEFDNTSFSVNPGLSGVFAWLSQIAANYDEYELEHLVFHYKPVISQASTSGAMGSILLSCNYNAGSQKFESFREMAEYSGTLETRVCDEAMFGVECDPTKHGSQAIEYIRTGAMPAGQDIKTYDLGLFQIATSDVSTFEEGTLLGHLYVEYQVILGKPKLFTALGKGILSDMHRGGTGLTQAAPFGTVKLRTEANSLGCVLSSSDGSIVFPDNFYGRVTVTYTGYGTGLRIGFPTVSGNVTAVPIMGLNGNATSERSVGTAETTAMVQGLYDITASSGGIPNVVRIVMDTATTLTNFNLDIAQSNPDLDPVWI